ncbi:hypothetical protein FHS83_002460 [Rhizomicrobium palustre]|uniref:LamG-like jellyroll fold domain-containing protein n=1 Tax=Rhizomicrobium palustre TaxID=189966 RepID=A0A846N1P6_9PROT|nr:hypothetical protein [Rhizomicrobium palustre]NIK89142.1 hypothetical protein [Rhizomicrobium palustre]
MHRISWKTLLCASCAAAFGASAFAGESGLLFSMSANPRADFAQGDPIPNFADQVSAKKDASGSFVAIEDTATLAWHAAHHIYAQRGTLSFAWRARYPLGRQQFPIFRVSYGDHSSWDMAWLRIDWNGHGFDAFVTDANLARVRVSYRIATVPSPDQWIRLAFSWDETRGIRLYVDGHEVARKDTTAVLEAGLDQFGPHGRTISPHQAHALYQFARGGDLKNLKIYDHMLTLEAAVALAADAIPASETYPTRSLAQSDWEGEWRLRYGWNRPNDPPFYLTAPSTHIRLVPFTAAWDLKERMTNGNDGIAETTWPGVYNRSKLPGRDDYFELPDWNVYVEGGKSVTFDLPKEPWNHVEFQGAAFGKLTYLGTKGEKPLAERPSGQERTYYQFSDLEGGCLRFDNVVQETPIQELQAFHIAPGQEPLNEFALSYRVNASADPALYPSTGAVRDYIDGRYVADERSIVVALPDDAPLEKRDAKPQPSMPIVHVVIPNDFRYLRNRRQKGHFAYGWNNIEGGLDGIAIDLPALKVTPAMGGLIPLNIQIKDPIWPGRNLMDVSVSVKPGEARTLWLDTRDRLLPNDSALYLSIASASADFNAAALDGAKIRLVFKPRREALTEHIADRLDQVKDNYAWLVEEHTSDERFSRLRRLEAEFASLFQADPENKLGRLYWAELNPSQGWPAFTRPVAPKGIPAWAYLQTEDLKLVHRFVEWWIDKRQVAYGDFGGGISDDDDLTQQWPGLALMGVMPEKINKSLGALTDAVDRNGMITNGLGTIVTDYLHSYEEGINARAEDMYLNWGAPKTVERLMQTARAYPRIIETNTQGHTHIVSQLFSSTDVVRERQWGWAIPYSNLILHPAVLLAEYNGNPAMKALVLSVADGFLAHGRKDASGKLVFPEEVNAATDEARGRLGPGSRGVDALVQLFWSAYHLTGDEKYLAPIDAVLDPAPGRGLALMNASLLTQLETRSKGWGAKILADLDRREAEAKTAHRPPGFLLGGENGAVNDARYFAWLLRGDKRYLEDLFADEVQLGTQRMPLVTEGHWWTDRVEVPNALLQRTRLGGVATSRGLFAQGNLISWRFAGASDAESVGLLVHDPRPDRFTVEVYNLSNKPIEAVMTGAALRAGIWTMAGEGQKEKRFAFGRGRSLKLHFKPHETVILHFALVEAGPDVSTLPDLGIGPEDVAQGAEGIDLTVHNLGSVASKPAFARLLDAKGKVLASAAVPVIAPPLDNTPQTVRVHLPALAQAVKTEVVMDGEEITRANNIAVLPHP